MSETEHEISDGVVGELDAGATKASVATTPMHGAGVVIDGTHYGPGTSPMTAGTVPLHAAGTETRPLGPGWNVGPDSDDQFSKSTRLQVQARHRAADESFLAFSRGYVSPSGTVPGLAPINRNSKERLSHE